MPTISSTRVHTTLSGRRIEYTPSPAVAAFLERLAAYLDDEKTTEQEGIGLAYSKENPLLDPTIHPERGMVTKEVFANPAYSVMTDLLFRKRVVQEGIDVNQIAARYTLTVQQAADRLGVHHTTIRQAIHAKRIASWTKDGQLYLEPSAVDRLEVSARSPAARVVGGPLQIVCGHGKSASLKFRAVNELESVERVEGNVVKGVLREWKRVAVLTKGARGAQRAFVLEPSAEESEAVRVPPFAVLGRFRIVEKANGKKAAEVFKNAGVE